MLKSLARKLSAWFLPKERTSKFDAYDSPRLNKKQQDYTTIVGEISP
jgi:hypothetical protein